MFNLFGSTDVCHDCTKSNDNQVEKSISLSIKKIHSEQFELVIQNNPFLFDVKEKNQDIFPHKWCRCQDGTYVKI